MSDKGSAIVFVGAIAGTLIAFVSGLPMGVCANTLIILFAGGAVVRTYTGGRPIVVGGKTGAGLGAATAVVAALVNGAIGAVLTMVGARPGWDEAAQESIRLMRERGISEQQIETIRQMFESSWFFPAVMGCGLLFYALFGAIGGIIGASFFGQEE